MATNPMPMSEPGLKPARKPVKERKATKPKVTNKKGKSPAWTKEELTEPRDCKYCGGTTFNGTEFCDADCKEDFAYWQKIEKETGHSEPIWEPEAKELVGTKGRKKVRKPAKAARKAEPEDEGEEDEPAEEA